MELRNYELVVIASASLTNEENETLVKKFTGLIAKQGGKVAHESSWGRRKLPYEVNKQKNGIFTLLWIKANGPIIEEVERQLGYDEKILKFYVMSVENLDVEHKKFEAMKADPAINAKLITEVVGA